MRLGQSTRRRFPTGYHASTLLIVTASTLTEEVGFHAISSTTAAEGHSAVARAFAKASKSSTYHTTTMATSRVLEPDS